MSAEQEIADDVLEELCSILAMEQGVEASISNDLEHVANVYALGKARSQGEKRPAPAGSSGCSFRPSILAFMQRASAKR